jgi:hypothetical protein
VRTELGEGERRERCEEMEQSKEILGIGNEERKGRSAGVTRLQTHQSHRRFLNLTGIYLGGARCCARHNSYFTFCLLFSGMTVSPLLLMACRHQTAMGKL